MSKIGICISTCDRPNYLKECLKSLDNIDAVICICDDGHNSMEPITPSSVKYLSTPTPRSGVSKNKNLGFKYLFNQGCDYIFMIEDDCRIIDHAIFDKYIEASHVTGIQHFNFGPGAPWNRKQKNPHLKGDLSRRAEAEQYSAPAPRMVVEYNDDVAICLYEHVIGMFSFFTRKGLEIVGFFDEDYYNAWEHVDHTLRFIDANLTSPFWHFADIRDSELYISAQKDEKANSSLSKNEEEFNKIVSDGISVFKNKHNIVPGQIKQKSKSDILSILKTIRKEYSKYG
jgi:GT2 family glycosyltransferase